MVFSIKFLNIIWLIFSYTKFIIFVAIVNHILENYIFFLHLLLVSGNTVVVDFVSRKSTKLYN